MYISYDLSSLSPQSKGIFIPHSYSVCIGVSTQQAALTPSSYKISGQWGKNYLLKLSEEVL